METEKKFRDNLKRVSPSTRILLGVSGGVDSVTMLDLFFKSGYRNLVVAHYNHGVRKESDLDEKFVRTLAAKHNVEFVSEKLGKVAKGNLEEEMRLARRRFLEKTAEMKKADYIALAHNANDQAETFFLNLLRGSGPAGLAGMKSEGKIIRPLLSISREEILDYARKNGLAWQEDLSNADIGYHRNYLRHEILPKLSKLNPAWLETLARTSRLQRNIDDYLKEEARQYLASDINKMRELPKPLLYEVFGLLYEKAKGDRIDLTLKNLSDLEALIGSSQGTKRLELPNQILAVRSYERLDFVLKNDYNLKPQTETKSLKSGINIFRSFVIEIRPLKNGRNNNNKIHLPESLFSKLTVEMRHDGDKIETVGGTKKLSDLFVNAKIKKEERDSWPIFRLNGKIIWVPKLALNRDLKHPKTEIELRVKEKNES